MIIASLMNFAGPDMIIILLIILVLFGAKRLPGLARGMGEAVKEFQKAKDDLAQNLDVSSNPRPSLGEGEREGDHASAYTPRAAAGTGGKSTV